MDAYGKTLEHEFAGRAPDLTEENLQARIRGNLLMALSNKFGWLVLTTGNKSEMSVGYTTLYGDLAGGFAVIKDVPKTLVYRLCEWRNSPRAPSPGAFPGHRGRAGTTIAPAKTPIPPSIIARAPSAELRHDQRDEDSLPPYELLDRILQGYIELDQSREQLIAQGLPAEEVDRTIRLVDLAEYKRRQAPPGHQDHHPRLRPRPANADHQPLPGLAARRSRDGTLPTLYCRPPCAPLRRRAVRLRRHDPGQADSPNILERDDRRRVPGLLGGRFFGGLAITDATHDPSGAYSVQYGNCLRGAGRVRHAAADRHLARQQFPARRSARPAAALVRGVSAIFAGAAGRS